MPRIFNREPALWLALTAVLVKMAAAFGLDVSVDQQAAVNAAAAVVVGLVVAVMVHDGVGTAVLGVVQGVLALAVGFGLDWSADRQAVVMSLAAAVVAMWTRTQVTAPEPAKAALPSLNPAANYPGV